MGLFTELICLRDFVIKKVGVKQAINSWVGPESDKQDFLLEDAAIEVKSHRTSKGAFAFISSYHQLNREKEPLYLFSYALTSAENGKSVEDIAQNIRTLVPEDSIEIIDTFEYKLIEYGYIPELVKEPLQRFIVDRVKAYHISNGFPRISITELKSQIIDIKYVIDLSKCDSFEVQINSLLNSG